MNKRYIGAEILEGHKEIQAYKQGRIELGTTRSSAPSALNDIRTKPALTQASIVKNVQGDAACASGVFNLHTQFNPHWAGLMAGQVPVMQYRRL